MASYIELNDMENPFPMQLTTYRDRALEHNARVRTLASMRRFMLGVIALWTLLFMIPLFAQEYGAPLVNAKCDAALRKCDAMRKLVVATKQSDPKWVTYAMKSQSACKRERYYCHNRKYLSKIRNEWKKENILSHGNSLKRMLAFQVNYISQWPKGFDLTRSEYKEQKKHGRCCVVEYRRSGTFYGVLTLFIAAYLFLYIVSKRGHF